MSEALFKLGGLRFWSEDEIELREAFQARVTNVIKRRLLDVNPAWRFARCEGPILHPRSQIIDAYDDSDIFITNDVRGDEALCLRAETTPSSYAYARHLGGKMPLCVWQAGISARRETNDGASASKLRFNSFWQLEFQAIYRADSKADYRAALIPDVQREIERFCKTETRVVESDRLPSYSRSTIDIEAMRGDRWTEMASCSIREDFGPDLLVCEIAIGLDRIASVAGEAS
jgi:glycyl-tRNA synthetase